MKISATVLTFTFFISLFLNSYAQVNMTYVFSQPSGTYSEIPSADTTVAFATGTDPGTNESMDDVIYSNNSLPFTFMFNGYYYNNVVISSNGFITFGTTYPSTSTYSPILSTEAYAGEIAGYGSNLIGTRGINASRTMGSSVLTGVSSADLVGVEVGRIITGTGIPAGTTITSINSGSGFIYMSANATTNGVMPALVATGSIIRKTSGSVGTRVHTIQFRNLRNYATGQNHNCLNFQIKLYETTNVIEIIYGTATTSTNVSGQVGLRGAVNTDYHNRTTGVNWSFTQTGNTPSAFCLISQTILPPSGLTFRWSPVFLQVKTVVQGFYNGVSNSMIRKDTITANMRSSSSPYNIIATAKAMADSVNYSCNFYMPGLSSGTYYLSLKHRNSIQTWCKSGGVVYTPGSAFTYNFTLDSSKTYGNNVKRVDQTPVTFAMFSGDVNQNGAIDATDLSLIENDASNFVTGYVNTDLTGDSVADASDAALCDNNVFNFVVEVKP